MSVPYNRSLDLTKSRSSSSQSLQMANSSNSDFSMNGSSSSSGSGGQGSCKRWSLRSIMLLLVGGFFIASVQKGFELSRVYTRSIKDSSSPSYSHREVLGRAQRRTRIKFAKGIRGQMDLSTTRLVQATLQHFLQQVEEEAGSDSQISVGLMKDTILQVMEHIEIEALAQVSSTPGVTTGGRGPSSSSGTTAGTVETPAERESRASSAQLRSKSSEQQDNKDSQTPGEETSDTPTTPVKEQMSSTLATATLQDIKAPSSKSSTAVKEAIASKLASYSQAATTEQTPPLPSSPPGERTAFAKATQSGAGTTSNALATQNGRPDGLKVALYMTTHVSDEHLEFIQKCWPAAMRKLEIFQHVDLIVYTSSKKHDRLFRGMGFDKVQIYRYNETKMAEYEGVDVNKVLPNNLNMQKQQGALRAMVDPFLVDPSAEQDNWKVADKSWFDNYDWVIRVNPDVMVRRDAWLLKQMRNPQIQGIFVRWDTPYFGLYLHTDFYAFRPQAVNPGALIREYKTQYKAEKFHAERHFRSGFTHLQDKTPPQVAFLPNVNKTKIGIGHVGGPNCDVVHVHELVQHCPNYFNARHRKGFY